MWQLSKFSFGGILVCLSFFGASIKVPAQNLDNAKIASQIAAYKNDLRGPYRDIRWFCIDGTTVAPKERCPEKGGVQRARYKDEVLTLASQHHIFLGQILSTTKFEDFWDEAHDHSRIKQYQLEKFLRASDQGWINRKAQFYRGAYQIEDEQTWGQDFFTWLLVKPNISQDQYFLLRQICKDLPHGADSQVAQSVRAISKEIADVYPAFMNLRVKIHGQPAQEDLAQVKIFYADHKSKINASLAPRFEKLISEMAVMYEPIKLEEFRKYIKGDARGNEAGSLVENFIVQYPLSTTGEQRCQLIAQTSLDLRRAFRHTASTNGRLGLLDFSVQLEAMLNQEINSWEATTLGGQWTKVYALAKASCGFGYLELWEWDQIAPDIKPKGSERITVNALSDLVDDSRRCLEWGAGMIRSNYEDIVGIYSGFEPMSSGFVDDQVRSSMLLPLGASISLLGEFFSKMAGISNDVMGIPGQSAIRGLNPGFAMGELVVTNQPPENLEISGEKIYVFNRPPSDLKPIAGIATVTEGNMVSHVQLLARNLGIPNAVFSAGNLNSLLNYSGETVFYAVTPKGSVIMKLASAMTEQEKMLFSKKSRKEEKITVPIERMVLDKPQILSLADVDATHSGKQCGPKAANLGQLKQMFPENVVEGLVIPFSIFKSHFDQPMPGQTESYWSFLKFTFENAENMRQANKPAIDIETYIVGRLATLRTAIKSMSLSPDFVNELRTSFKKILGKDLGKVPVFVRSDTNMEDLKDFTGAGLNLTLFNVLEADKIIQGIKDVWASPYTERSYKWRQKYLLNPENVFPSILIIPSVNADVSGVMITKGLTTGSLGDVTIAFNRGVGGAVDGQASETWLLTSHGRDKILSPARETKYTLIPVTGGTTKSTTTFQDPMLDKADLKSLRLMSKMIKERFSTLGNQGPHDVELGMKDGHIWLFQIRPFVENKKASSSEYLLSISPKVNGQLKVDLKSKL